MFCMYVYSQSLVSMIYLRWTVYDWLITSWPAFTYTYTARTASSSPSDLRTFWYDVILFCPSHVSLSIAYIASRPSSRLIDGLIHVFIHLLHTHIYRPPSLTKPHRIIIVRHGESTGNVDESVYVTTPDWKVCMRVCMYKKKPTQTDIYLVRSHTLNMSPSHHIRYLWVKKVTNKREKQARVWRNWLEMNHCTFIHLLMSEQSR